MTFANGFARGVALTALALGSMGVVSAQNGTNYHVLCNNGDAAFIGVGAGGAQTAADGIGTFIPGEDLRGSLQADPDGGGPIPLQFCWRNTGFRESVCVFAPGTSGFLQIRFPGIYMVELAGAVPNPAPGANLPKVFTRPTCKTPITASFIAYGTGPSSTASFVATTSSAFGPTQTIILPNDGLTPTGQGGTATLVQGFAGQLPASPTGNLPSAGCYVVQFVPVASAVPYLDKIDGIWHYAMNSDDANQYWVVSDDEMQLWQSQTLSTDGGLTALPAFFSVVDYDLLLASLEANTTAIIAPHGIEQAGPYYAQTFNMTGGGGPNFGFDVGRGSRGVSFGGKGGVKVPAGLGGLGSGAQDPAYGGGAVPFRNTLGFATWDNKPNIGVIGKGSDRLLWLGIDTAMLGGLGPCGNPGNPNITKLGGTVRLPVIGTGFMQAVTNSSLPTFIHTTKVAAGGGWPDPDGIPSGAFGVPAIAGGSIQVRVDNLVNKVPCTVGGTIPLNITYGTTGRNHFPPPTLTWDPSNADISGTKEVFLWK
jgi:hypothetical protein